MNVLIEATAMKRIVLFLIVTLLVLLCIGLVRGSTSLPREGVVHAHHEHVRDAN